MTAWMSANRFPPNTQQNRRRVRSETQTLRLPPKLPRSGGLRITTDSSGARLGPHCSRLLQGRGTAVFSSAACHLRADVSSSITAAETLLSLVHKQPRAPTGIKTQSGLWLERRVQSEARTPRSRAGALYGASGLLLHRWQAALHRLE